MVRTRLFGFGGALEGSGNIFHKKTFFKMIVNIFRGMKILISPSHIETQKKNDWGSGKKIIIEIHISSKIFFGNFHYVFLFRKNMFVPSLLRTAVRQESDRGGHKEVNVHQPELLCVLWRVVIFLTRLQLPYLGYHNEKVPAPCFRSPTASYYELSSQLTFL